MLDENGELRHVRKALKLNLTREDYQAIQKGAWLIKNDSELLKSVKIVIQTIQPLNRLGFNHEGSNDNYDDDDDSSVEI
jgi:hypothetical protein